MKKYYDLPKSRLVAMLNWNNGYGSYEDAKNQFGHDDFREITLKEFNKLGKEYSSNSSTTLKDLEELI